jgi:hypothetical protein
MSPALVFQNKKSISGKKVPGSGKKVQTYSKN